MTLAVTGWATAISMVGPLLVDLARDFDVPIGQLGLLGAAISLPWALGAPLTGLLSDRLGRRPLMVLALVGVGTSTIASAFTTDFATLLATRFIGGLLGSFGPASTMAAIGDLVPAQFRGSAMGWLNLGFGLAAIAGVPLVGVVAGLFGWRWAFAAVGLTLLVFAALVHLVFPPTPPTGRGLSLRATYRNVLGTPKLGNVLGANALERAIFNAVVLYMPSFLMLSYGLGPAEVAPALVVVAIGTIGGNTLGSWLGDRLPRAAVFVVAQATAGLVALLLFGMTAGLAVSVGLALSFGTLNALSRPAFLALGSELGSSRDRGAVLGLLSLTNQGGSVIGSALGGLMLALAGYPGLAVATLLAGLAAAALALPLTRAAR